MSKQVISKHVVDRRREAVINPHSDPITGETGSHPIATGIGAGVVGTIGMLVGSVTGPVGAIAGAAIGSILGGLVGKSAAEATHPTIEDYDVRVIDPIDMPRKNVVIQRQIQPVPVRPTSAPTSTSSEAFSRVGTPQTAEQSIIQAALRGRRSLAANEDRYWQQHYIEQPYYQSGLTYRDYQPAYRLGYEGYTRYHGTGMSYDEVEPELQQQYERNDSLGGESLRRSSWLSWEQARHAVRDGWYRVERAFCGR
jgi:hypothetical protein